MKKTLFIFLILVIVLGAVYVFASVAPSGSSYHPVTYTDTIKSATDDTGVITVIDPIEAEGGLIIDVCFSDVTGDCPTALTAVDGQLWLEDIQTASGDN